MCTDGSIVTVTQYNDGTIDCQDGSDETSMYECQASWGSDQIPLFYVNDGYANCADGLDEDSTPDSSEIDCQSEDGQRIAASSFFDGTDDCNNGWDEMEFHVASNCNWQDGAGWSCDAVYMNPVATWTFHEETNENGLAVYVLSSLEKSVETRSVFDAETHAFLSMSVIEKDRTGATVGLMNLTTQVANPSIFEGLSVNNNLPFTHRRSRRLGPGLTKMGTMTATGTMTMTTAQETVTETMTMTMAQETITGTMTMATALRTTTADIPPMLAAEPPTAPTGTAPTCSASWDRTTLRTRICGPWAPVQTPLRSCSYIAVSTRRKPRTSNI